MIDAYTDYPFDIFEDTDKNESTIRKCMILTYDRNKYCDVMIFFTDGDGDERATIREVKAGYCYLNPVRLGDGEITFNHEYLCTLPWKS
jgi:hypothetical protein